MAMRWKFVLSDVKKMGFRTQRGNTLLGVLIALGILGLCAVPFLSGLTTSVKGGALAEEQVDVDSIARAQMEYVKNYPYQIGLIYPAVDTYEATYNPDPVTLPGNYSIAVDAEDVTGKTGLQLITVTVSKSSEDLLELKGYKVNR